MEKQDAPQAAVLEIVERRRGKPDGTIGDELVVPTEVRLNGQLLLTPTGDPIRVHEIKVSADGEHFVLATLTLAVKRLVVAAEWPKVQAEKRGEEYRRKLANRDLLPQDAVPAAEASS